MKTRHLLAAASIIAIPLAHAETNQDFDRQQRWEYCRSSQDHEAVVHAARLNAIEKRFRQSQQSSRSSSLEANWEYSIAVDEENTRYEKGMKQLIKGACSVVYLSDYWRNPACNQALFEEDKRDEEESVEIAKRRLDRQHVVNVAVIRCGTDIHCRTRAQEASTVIQQEDAEKEKAIRQHKEAVDAIHAKCDWTDWFLSLPGVNKPDDAN